MELTAPALAFLAGLLSILSPCVLPLVPIVVSTALSRHRFGAIALAAGLAAAFLAMGLFVAAVGFAIGLDDVFFSRIGAVLLIAFGSLLLVPSMQARLALAAGPVGDWAERRFGGLSAGGNAGQFSVGVLLGVVWSPCVGPTLGAASVMAAQRQDLGEVVLVMLLFAVGTALPLIIIGLLSREALARWRGRLLSAERGGKAVLGTFLLASGVLILSGIDRTVEAWLRRGSPTSSRSFDRSLSLHLRPNPLLLA